MIGLLLLPAAQACSCVAPRLERDLVPRDGATAFPTDGRLRVWFSGGWPTDLVERLGDEYRLRGPDGALVPLAVEVEGTTLVLAPRRDLAPHATHTVERVYAYADGRLVSDERWMAVVGGRPRAKVPTPAEVGRYWYPEARFMTGDGPAGRPVGAPVVEKATWSARRGGGDCGPGEGVGVDLRVPAGLDPSDVLGLEVRGRGVVWRARALAWPTVLGPAPEDGLPRQASANDYRCSPAPVHLDVSRRVRVRAVAWSAAGERVRGPWVVAQPGKDARVPGRHRRSREPLPVDAFLSPPPEEPSRPATTGPTACPFGLSGADPAYVVEREWVQVRRYPKAWLGPGGPWALVEDTDKALSLAPVGRPGEAVPVGPIRDAVAAPAAGDPPLVVAARAEGGRVRVARPGAWERELQADQDAMPTAAVGGGRVFVLWTRRGEGDAKRERWPTWVVLDEATGEELARGGLGEDEGPATGEARAAGWDGEAFVVSWDHVGYELLGPTAPRVHTETDGERLTRVLPDGRVAGTLRLPTLQSPALAVAEGVIVGAWDVDRVTHVAWLDRTGIVAGPFPIAPELGAWEVAVNGELAAVVNGGAFGGDAKVYVVDRAGRVSPPWTLGHGAPALAPSLAPAGDGFLVGYGSSLYPGDGWRPTVERLECRSDVPFGAPDAIE